MRDTIDVIAEKMYRDSKAVEKILAEAEYACIVSDRNNAVVEIATLKAAKQLVFSRKLSDGLGREILRRETNLKEITSRLKIICEKLGINANADNKGEL